MSEVMTVQQAIEQTGERFLTIAPAQMKFESEKGFAVQILKNNPYLMDVAKNHPQSLQQALTNVAAIGLSLNPAEKLAYLIPRSVKDKVNGVEKYVTKVFLEPSYMGLIRLATDSGSIKWAQALPVYSSDEFTFNGVGEKPTHKFNPFQPMESRGKFIGVYCVAKTAEGDYLTSMMSEEQVFDIRGRSEQYKKSKSGPWVTDFIEQAKKSVMRNGFKTWPRTDLNRLAAAVALSNDNEGYEPILSTPSLGEYSADTKEYFDQLISQQNGLGMFCLQVILNDKNDGVWTNLYNSFEKGQIGKFKQIVKDLETKGFVIVTEIREALILAVDAQDDLAVKELVMDLSADELNVVLRGLEHNYVSAINEINV